MKDTDQPNPSPNPKPAGEKEMWLSKDGIVAVPKTPPPNPAETAQEAVHQVMPKTDVPKANLPKPASTT